MKKIMVFDVGGTEVKYSVVGEDLSINDSGYFPTPNVKGDNVKALWEGEGVDEAYEDFLDKLCEVYRPHAGETEGIAMSLPGFIDTQNGRQCGGGALPYIIRRDIAKDLSAKAGCAVRIANDGKCAALAEKKSGSLTECKNASVFIIGTGVGGGLIINDRVLNGTHFTAGEFSFFRVNMDGDWSDRKNTLGDVCSTRGLLLEYRKAKGLPKDADMDGRRFFEQYNAGEKEAVDTLKLFCRRVAMTIQNLTFLLDLEKIAIGGGISKQPALLEGIRKAIDDLDANSGLVYDPNMPKAEVVSCHYSSEANQIGAYFLFLEDI